MPRRRGQGSESRSGRESYSKLTSELALRDNREVLLLPSATRTSAEDRSRIRECSF